MKKTHLAKLVLQPIRAGFPNPAEEAGEIPLDLNALVVKHPASTFYMRVEGESMQGIGIHTGDIVVIDRSLEARSRDIVVAYLDGEFTLKRLQINGGSGQLLPENEEFESLEVTEDSDFQVWGVVTYTLHQHKQG